MHVRRVTRRFLRRGLAAVRASGRKVLWTPPRIGVGNQLYLWLWARVQREAGIEAWVRHDPLMDPWLEEFPMLERLTLRKGEIRFRDNRVLEFAQTWGHHYTGEQLRAFAAELVVEPPFAERMSRLVPCVPRGTLVVNVRRGDYYSVPEHRARYGFDIVNWVDTAVVIALESGPLARIQLVSDDLDWCREHLGHLDALLPTSFDRVGDGPQDDLAVLALAPSLVLANSTFSYWGAHLHSALRGGGGHEVVAPLFHARGQSADNHSYHLDPRWRVVDEIPAGWGLPEDEGDG